jgi:hypothetical protein
MKLKPAVHSSVLFSVVVRPLLFDIPFSPGEAFYNMVMQVLRKVGNFLAPPASKSEDGRDQWPSRAAFLLAAMGGCAGQGKS